MWGGYVNADKMYNKIQDTKIIPTKSSYMDQLIGERTGFGAPDQQYEQRRTPDFKRVTETSNSLPLENVDTPLPKDVWYAYTPYQGLKRFVFLFIHFPL